MLIAQKCLLNACLSNVDCFTPLLIPLSFFALLSLDLVGVRFTSGCHLVKRCQLYQSAIHTSVGVFMLKRAVQKFSKETRTLMELEQTASLGQVSSGASHVKKKKKGFWNLWPQNLGICFSAIFVDAFVMSDQKLLQ